MDSERRDVSVSVFVSLVDFLCVDLSTFKRRHCYESIRSIVMLLLNKVNGMVDGLWMDVMSRVLDNGVGGWHIVLVDLCLWWFFIARAGVLIIAATAIVFVMVVMMMLNDMSLMSYNRVLLMNDCSLVCHRSRIVDGMCLNMWYRDYRMLIDQSLMQR